MPATTNKPLSLGAAINVLAFAFADPVNSGVCASRMRVAAVRVEDELVARENENDKVKFAKSIPKFLRASIRLLTRKQSRAEYISMVDHILCCRCNLNDPKIRALHYPRLEGHDTRFGSEAMMHLRTTVQIIVWFLKLVLFGMTKNKFRGLEESETAGSVKPWPYDEEDLLPSGFGDTIAALTIWEAQAGGFHIFKLATALGQFYPPFLEALVLDTQYHFALIRPLSMLDQALGWFEKDPAKYMTTEGNADLIVTDPVEMAFQFWFNLHSIVGFLIGVRILSPKVIPVMERLRRVLPSLPATNHWKRNVKAGCSRMLSAANGFDYDSDVEDDAIPSSSDDPEIELIKDALDEMTRARRGGCCHVFCPQTFETAYARLCSKCDVLRYCGEECQRGAWKLQRFPHKALCSKIQALREEIGPQSWPILWQEGMTMRRFLELPKSKDPDLLNLKQINDEMEALRAWKLTERQEWELSR